MALLIGLRPTGASGSARLTGSEGSRIVTGVRRRIRRRPRRPDGRPRMDFVDINTFFAPRAGGIRTYHQAKIAWFSRHPEHRYHLVCPGPRRRSRELASNVIQFEVFGPRLGRDPEGYRLMVDYGAVYRLLRDVRPAVVEAGDPWLTGGFCLLVHGAGKLPGLLSSFYHSDVVRTWVDPWAGAPGGLPGVRRMAGRLAGRLFYGLQRAYPITVVAARSTGESLRAQGVTRVVRLPFGADPAFFAREEPRPRSTGRARLLYAGRLGHEKGAELLLRTLPRLLGPAGVEVTVAGRGSHAPRFAAFRHPRYRYLGFVADRGEMARVFREHDVLLAPGRHETFGLSVLEGLAAGLVVVGPDAGGTADLLRELRSPFVFRAGDDESFVEAVAEALRADREEAARDGRALALRYGTWDDAIGRMVDEYVRMAADAGRPPPGAGDGGA